VAGGRVRIHDNEIRDAGGGAILIDFGAANLTYPLVDVFRNYGFDDQATPTETSVVQFENAPEVTVWTLSDNIAGENVTTLVSGLTSGTWLTHDGTPADWAGFGSPNSVVTAVVGSTYRQLDGTGASITWTKQVGTGNTGWVADALQSTAPTFTGVTLGAQVVSTATSGLSANHGTLGTGSTNWSGNVTSVGANTSVVLTLAASGFASRSWCTAQTNSTATPEIIVVTNSATAPTFSCFNSTTGTAANCDDFTYGCSGQ
jgi:hypothetical protein